MPNRSDRPAHGSSAPRPGNSVITTLSRLAHARCPRHQTAQATQDIGRRLAAIQHDSASAAEALALVAGTIERIAASQQAITAAVGEQDGIRDQIRGDAGRASDGTAAATTRIATVRQASDETSVAATDTKTAASDLAGMAAGLREAVGGFRLPASRSASTTSREHLRAA